MNEDIIDLVRLHFTEALDKQEKDIIDYMNKYMTQEERNQHGDNIWNMLVRAKSSLAFLELKLMANQINYK